MQGKTQSERKLTENLKNENPYTIEEAGCYYLGPDVEKYVRNLIAQYLARKKGTDEYYLMKMLIINDAKDNLHERGAFHTECTILSLLKGHPGVIQLHDFFRDSVLKGKPGDEHREEIKRIFMVLECLIPHGGRNQQLIPLHKYLSERKKLSECEALHIFINILLVIDDLHKKNIVHKDLRLSNVILDRKTLKIKLINFYYAKLVSSENEMSYMQRGNPSYTAPEAILGKPVSPKPCDMRSAGIILYALLHGYLPLIGENCSSFSAMANSQSLSDIYSKIISNDYIISEGLNVSEGTKLLIRGLLCRDPISRLKSSEAVDIVRTIIAVQSSCRRRIFASDQCCNQIVPGCPFMEKRSSSSRLRGSITLRASPLIDKEMFEMMMVQDHFHMQLKSLENFKDYETFQIVFLALKENKYYSVSTVADKERSACKNVRKIAYLEFGRTVPSISEPGWIRSRIILHVSYDHTGRKLETLSANGCYKQRTALCVIDTNAVPHASVTCQEFIRSCLFLHVFFLDENNHPSTGVVDVFEECIHEPTKR